MTRVNRGCTDAADQPWRTELRAKLCTLTAECEALSPQAGRLRRRRAWIWYGSMPLYGRLRSSSSHSVTPKEYTSAWRNHFSGLVLSCSREAQLHEPERQETQVHSRRATARQWS